jgi:hypothetical protein
MALSGMLAEVTQDRVAGLLEERQPDILDASVPAEVTKFEARVTDAAGRVVLLVGPDPVAGPIRSLAVDAISYETASEIEYATYPEQQAPGDTGRGYHLHQKFLETLADLKATLAQLGGVPADGGAAGVVLGVASPRGTFPPPQCYPDPVRDYGRGYRYGASS